MNLLVSVEEHLFAQAIKTLIDAHFNFNTHAASLSTKKQIIEFCNSKQIDLLILDMDHSMQDKFSLIEELTQHSKSAEIIAITNQEDQLFLQKIIRAGANGLILKDSNKKILKKAINSVINGSHYICDEIAFGLAKSPRNEQQKAGYRAINNELTDREKEVLILICQEMTNHRIAQKLQLSVRTIDSHRRNLLQKTGSNNTVGIVKYAIRNKLLEI